MKIICTLLLCITGHFAFAQGYGDKVQVWLNKTQVVKKYQTGGNTQEVVVKPGMMIASNVIKITVAGFKEAGWKRIFSIIDTLGNEVFNFEKVGPSGTFVWRVSGLQAKLKQYGRLQLHTTALPTDPRQAALVRVARYHVCTLVYKP